MIRKRVVCMWLSLNELLEVICLHTVKRFQAFQYNIGYSIYQVFLSNTNNFHTVRWFQIINNNNPL